MEVETHPKPETRIEAAVGDAQATGIDDSEGRLESENPEIEEGKPARGGSSLKPGDVPEKLFGELDNEIAPPIRTRQIGMIVSGDPHPDPAQEVSDKENSLVPGAGIKDKEDPGVKPGQPGLESDPQETKKAHSSSLASGGVSEVQPQAGGGGLEAKSAHDMVKPDSKPPQENLVGDGTPVDTIVIEAKDSTSVMEEKPVADVASPANGTNGIHKLGKASGEVSTSLDSKAEPLQDKKAEVETSQESKRISQTEEDVLKLFRFKYQCSFCNHCATQIQFPIDSLVVQCPKCNKHVSALTPRNTECFNCKEMLAHPSTANFIQCPKCLFLMNPKDSERKSYPPTFEPVKPAAGKKRKRVSSEDTLNAVAFNLYRQEHWVAMRNQSGVTDVMKLTNLLKETWKNLAPKVRETYERAAMASNQQSQSKKAVMHTVPPLGRGSMQQQAQANAAAMHHAPQYSLNQVRIEVQQANERFQQLNAQLVTAQQKGVNQYALQPLRMAQMQAYNQLQRAMQRLQMIQAQQQRTHVHLRAAPQQYYQYQQVQAAYPSQRLHSLQAPRQVVKIVSGHNGTQVPLTQVPLQHVQHQHPPAQMHPAHHPRYT